MAINANAMTALTARAPDAPVHWRPPQRLGGFLAPTTVVANGDTNSVQVNVLGSGRLRVSILVTGTGGTLRLRWILADHITTQPITAGNPADPGTAVVAATHLNIDIANNPGYAYLEVAFVNGAGSSTVTYCDVMQTAEGN